MYPELKTIIQETGISVGEVLSIARQITEDDTLRSIDLLTKVERAELVAVIEKLYCVAH